MHSNSKASHKIQEVTYHTLKAVNSQTFNALCNHGFNILKVILQVNFRVILKLFQVNYNLNYDLEHQLQSQIPITTSNTSYKLNKKSKLHHLLLNHGERVS